MSMIDNIIPVSIALGIFMKFVGKTGVYRKIRFLFQKRLYPIVSSLVNVFIRGVLKLISSTPYLRI